MLRAGGGGAHLDLLLDVALLELEHPRLEPLEEVDPGVDQRAGADKRHRRLRAADRLRLGPVRLQVVELLLELAARGERLGEDEVGVLEPLGERARRPGAEVLLDVEHAVGRRLLRRRRFRRDAHALRAGGGGALGGAVGHQPTGDGRARRQQISSSAPPASARRGEPSTISAAATLVPSFSAKFGRFSAAHVGTAVRNGARGARHCSCGCSAARTRSGTEIATIVARARVVEVADVGGASA